MRAVRITTMKAAARPATPQCREQASGKVWVRQVRGQVPGFGLHLQPLQTSECAVWPGVGRLTSLGLASSPHVSCLI